MLIEFGSGYIFNANDFSYAHKMYYSETNTWGIQIHLMSKDDILFDEFVSKEEVNICWDKLMADMRDKDEILLDELVNDYNANSGWYKLMADVKKAGGGM